VCGRFTVTAMILDGYARDACEIGGLLTSHNMRADNADRGRAYAPTNHPRSQCKPRDLFCCILQRRSDEDLEAKNPMKMSLV